MINIDKARARSARLLAASPLAIPRDEALANIARRRQALLQRACEPSETFAPEPMPVIDAPDQYAKDVLQRLLDKNTPPPRGVKPRLVGKNDNDPDTPAGP